jgi:hypothetical protein
MEIHRMNRIALATLMTMFLLAGDALAGGCDGKQLAHTYSSMHKDDQALRGRYIEILRMEHRGEKVDAKEKDRLEDVIYSTDTTNQKRLDELILRCGWPGKLDDKRAAFSAFLIIQHAPLEYQLKHFELVKAANQRGEVPSDKFAWLVDRVLVEQGKPQLYGTEFDYGTGAVAPIADPANLNQRRATMGLPPIASADRK